MTANAAASSTTHLQRIDQRTRRPPCGLVSGAFAGARSRRARGQQGALAGDHRAVSVVQRGKFACRRPAISQPNNGTARRAHLAYLGDTTWRDSRPHWPILGKVDGNTVTFSVEARIQGDAQCQTFVEKSVYLSTNEAIGD